VLPPVTVYTGKLPEDLTEEQLEAIQAEQSLRFQDIIHSQIIFQSGSRNRDIRIDALSPTTVNERLKEAGYTPLQASKIDAAKLGSILKVDVVLRGNLKMDRFMSDLNSMKIEAVETVLRNILINTNANVRLPGGVGNINRTYRIESTVEVIDVKDGIGVWKMSGVRNADWNYKPEDAIANMVSMFAQNFPYRNREYK
jgi:hypothetical protein